MCGVSTWPIKQNNVMERQNMTDKSKQNGSTNNPVQDFAPHDISLFNRVLASVRAEIENLRPQDQHRILLGLAGECVDTSAQIAAIHRPGIRVVELTILAERLSTLAHTYEE